MDFDRIDMVFIGGGQDTGQTHVARDLARRGGAVRDLVERGGAALAVCAGFQLFGAGYVTASGRELPGIGVFDAHSIGGPDRIIGNVIATTIPHAGESPLTLVGFENHGGKTYLDPGAPPLAHIVHGGGNLGDGRAEGAVYGNAIGTYLHGPLLPKNPRLADRLIAAALRHRYGTEAELSPLDDALERRAHQAAVARIERAAAAPSPGWADMAARGRPERPRRLGQVSRIDHPPIVGSPGEHNIFTARRGPSWARIGLTLAGALAVVLLAGWAVGWAASLASAPSPSSHPTGAAQRSRVATSGRPHPRRLGRPGRRPRR